MDKHIMESVTIDNFKDQLEAKLRTNSHIIKFCEDGDLTGMIEYTKNLNHACYHYTYKTGIFKACQNGHCDVVKHIINVNKNFIKDSNGKIDMRIFTEASRRGYVMLVELLYNCYANDPQFMINIAQKLIVENACIGNHIDIVNYIININDTYFDDEYYRHTAFICACQHNSLQVIKWLQKIFLTKGNDSYSYQNGNYHFTVHKESKIAKFCEDFRFYDLSDISYYLRYDMFNPYNIEMKPCSDNNDKCIIYDKNVI